MRMLISILGAFTFVVNLPATSRTFKVDRSTLAGWAITGAANQSAFAAEDVLSVPPGAQLSHSFQSSNLAVRIGTQPLIGTNASNWPVVEIGSAALLFSRDGSRGKLLVIVGDGAPVEFPASFALNAEGLSEEMVTVGFARHNSIVTVEALGKTLNLPADSQVSSTSELVISSGVTEPWLFDGLEVTVDGSSAPADEGTGKSAKAGNETTGIGVIRSGDGIDPGAVNGPRSSRNSRVDSSKTKSENDAPIAAALEIFTPPAVRHGRAEIIRAAAAQSQRK